MADDFDPTGMTVQQLQDAGHDVSLSPPGQQSSPQDDFDPTGMTLEQLHSAGAQVSDGPQQQSKLPPPEGGFASMLRSAVHSVIPTAAALPGMIAGGEAGFQAGMAAAPFLGPAAPLGPPVGAFIGGAIGGMIPGGLAGEAQEKVLNATGMNDAAQRQANAKENPIMSGIGEFAPAAVTFEVGDLSSKIAQRLLMGGGMGALDIAQQKIRGEGDINWSEAATQAAGGAIFNKPRGFIEPMAAKWAKVGREAGAKIPGVEAGQEFLTKNYPPGRPDLSDYSGATDLADDKKYVQPIVSATSPGAGRAGDPPPPRSGETPPTGYMAVESSGNKTNEQKPALQPQEPGAGPSEPYKVVNSQADDPTIASAMQSEAPPPTAPEATQPTPPQAAPPPQQARRPAPRGLTPEEQETMRIRQLPFGEQLKIIQGQKAQTPPAAEAAVQTSKKLSLPEKQATEKPAGELAEPPVKPSTPQNEGEASFANLVKTLAPNAEPAVAKARPGRYTNSTVSDKTIKALRATGNDAHAKLADSLDSLPFGQQREHEAARVWSAMHNQSGEVPTVLKNIRTRNQEVLNKLEVKGYTNPATGKPVRTGTVPNAIMYSKIHEINDRIHQAEELKPKDNETEEQVHARANAIVDAARAEAKAESQRMMEEARRPGSNLTDADKNHLIAAAVQLGNGKLPIENYTMNKLMKPPAWRLQRMAKDLINNKIPPDKVTQTLADGSTQSIVSATPWEKFLANEKLIRGAPEDYAEFVKNNIAEADTAKKTTVSSDLAHAEDKQAARLIARGKTGEEMARPEEEQDETLGDRLKREQQEDRVLDKMRSMKYDAAADKLENMPLGDARDKAFKFAEDKLLKTKQQPMARDKIKRPKDSVGFENLNTRILEAAAAKVADIPAVTEALNAGEKPKTPLGDLSNILSGKSPPPTPPEAPKGSGSGEPPRGRSNPMEYAKLLDDRLVKMDAAKKNYKQQIDQIGKAIHSEHPELSTPEMYEARTSDQIDKLPEALQKAYHETILPMELVTDTMFDNLRKVAPDQVGPKVENHVSRILLNGGDDGGSIDPYASGKSDDAMKVRNLKPVTTGTLKPRAFYGLEYAGGAQAGKMQVMSPKGDEGYTLWNNHQGTPVKDAGFQFEEGKSYTDPQGQKFIMRQAPEKMIEDNALLDNGQPPVYARNLVLSVLKANADAVNFALGHQFFNTMKQDPEWLDHATTNPNDPRIAENGWKTTSMKTFKHWYMEPELAHVLDDYAKPGFQDESWDWLRGMNQAVTRTIYLFPTVHLLNVAGFGFVQRGSAWLKPEYGTLVRTGSDAIKSVMTQDDLQKDLREAGLTLMSGFSHDWMQGLGKSVGQEIKTNTRQWDMLAKILGVGARDFAKALYDKSSHAMWTASDIIVTQAVLEREAQGMTRPEAISAVERIIPNYRIGTHFISNGNFGRFAAKLFSDPASMAFGPYHVGVLRSWGNMLNSAVKGKGKERTEALAQLTMMAVLAFAVKPALDKVAGLVTGNDNAEVRPMGPLTIPTNAVKAGLGQKDISAAVRDTFTIPPLMNTAQSLIRNQNFAGRPIVQPEDVKRAAHGSITSAGRAAVSAAEFAARGTIAPYNLAMGGLTENKQSIPGVIRDQMLGINNPTAASVRYEKLKPKFDLRSLKQEKKTEKDPIKRGFDALTR